MIEKNIFFDKNNNLNKNKLRESWFFNNLPIEYEFIKKFQLDCKFTDLKFSNVIYNYLNNIKDLPKCEQCNKKSKRFLGFKIGYDKFCSKLCSYRNSFPDALEKRKKNTFEKYGVSHTSKLESVKNKQMKTNIERYGFKSPTLNSNIKSKQESTMIERYGFKYTGNSEYLMNKVFKSRSEKYKNNILNTFPDLNIISIIKEGELEIFCDICKNKYTIRTELLRLRQFRYNTIACLNCNPISTYKYTAQNEILDLLSNLNLRIIRNDRTVLSGKEIDIYLPDNKIGIEYNGLYWHSDLYKDKNYHLDKKNKCIDKGINLIHVWEDDWLYKKDIVKSRIINLVKLNINKIYARKCSIREIDSKTSSKFLEENHLQGSISSKFRIGLFDNNILVSVMTFGKFRRSLGSRNKDGCWELYRFCNKLNTNVIGSFSKLLNYFEKNNKPLKLVTYANFDWSCDLNIYQKSGFDFISKTKPNYWYFTKDLKRTHRFNYRKNKIAKNREDLLKTEKEIMRNSGYNIIYDCGSIKYEKSYM